MTHYWWLMMICKWSIDINGMKWWWNDVLLMMMMTGKGVLLLTLMTIWSHCGKGPHWWPHISILPHYWCDDDDPYHWCDTHYQYSMIVWYSVAVFYHLLQVMMMMMSNLLLMSLMSDDDPYLMMYLFNWWPFLLFWPVDNCIWRWYVLCDIDDDDWWCYSRFHWVFCDSDDDRWWLYYHERYSSIDGIDDDDGSTYHLTWV